MPPDKDLANEFNYNYKTISAYPAPDEVLVNQWPYIRENIIDGCYRNVEHYLDTHFRLLREDYLRPLRNAICTYRKNLEDNPNEFNIYTKARFIPNSGPHLQGFNKQKPGDIRKAIQKRSYKILNSGSCRKYNADDFMTGNLLCFSSDNFQTVFFGIVKTGDYTSEKSLINIELFQETPFLYKNYYTILVSFNYFNPYYLVLKALQNSDTINFPMEKYIINVIKNRELLSSIYKTYGASLTLNATQSEAFQHALTSKFAIIQGPPGTGKTYLGLKIAKTLIENRLYNGETSSPILVVAYTNHALDQFLEGLLPYTKNIIRVGGQSQSDIIREYNFKPNFRYSKIVNEKLNNIYNSIQTLITNNESIMEELESVLSHKGFFDMRRITLVFPNLHNYLPDQESLQIHLWDQQNFRASDCKFHIMTISGLQKHVEKLKNENANKYEINQERILQIENVIKDLQEMLGNSEEYSKSIAKEPIDKNQVYNRRIRYFHMINHYIEYLKNKLNTNSANLKQLWEIVEKYKQKHNSESISAATIVGMTTSGAAQNQHLLANLNCQTVIIEEAAEILESHVIASFNSLLQTFNINRRSSTITTNYSRL